LLTLSNAISGTLVTEQQQQISVLSWRAYVAERKNLRHKDFLFLVLVLVLVIRF